MVYVREIEKCPYIHIKEIVRKKHGQSAQDLVEFSKI
jgi:hypothetical protein